MAEVPGDLPSGGGPAAEPAWRGKRTLFGRPEWVSSLPTAAVVEALSLRYPEVVTVPEGIIEPEAAAWSEVGLVARSLGSWVSADAMAREFGQRTGIAGEVHGAFLDNGYSFFRMPTAEAAEAVLARPWTVAGQAVAVERWRRGFFPVDGALRSALVWVRLPLLPVEFWSMEALRVILARAGDLISVDECTAGRKRLGFARACIRIDLSAELRPGVLLQGPAGAYWQRFVFEGVAGVCFSCGQFHAAGRCMASEGASAETVVGMGPWAVAVRKWNPGAGRGPGQGSAKAAASASGQSPSTGSPGRRPGKEPVGEKPEGGWSQPAKLARRRPPLRQSCGGSTPGASSPAGSFPVAGGRYAPLAGHSADRAPGVPKVNAPSLSDLTGMRSLSVEGRPRGASSAGGTPSPETNLPPESISPAMGRGVHSLSSSSPQLGKGVDSIGSAGPGPAQSKRARPTDFDCRHPEGQQKGTGRKAKPVSRGAARLPRPTLSSTGSLSAPPGVFLFSGASAGVFGSIQVPESELPEEQAPPSVVTPAPTPLSSPGGDDAMGVPDSGEPSSLLDHSDVVRQLAGVLQQPEADPRAGLVESTSKLMDVCGAGSQECSSSPPSSTSQ